MAEKVLEIAGLKVVFPSPRGLIRAVEGVDLTIERGQCLALVGESGCGKSVTSLAAMRLLGETALWRANALRVCGQDLLGLNERELQRLRGRHIAMIFQDALSALNPVMTVGRQLDEIYLRHFRATKAEAKRRSIEALDLVGVPDPERRYTAFPTSSPAACASAR